MFKDPLFPFAVYVLAGPVKRIVPSLKVSAVCPRPDPC
jgi:hypothetical protein